MNDTAQIDAKRFIKLFWPIFILCIMTIVVMRERMGIQAQGTTFKKETFENRIYMVDDSDFSAPVELNKECLVIAASNSDQSIILNKDIMFVLDDMRADYDVWYMDEEEEMPDLYEYRKIVVTSDDVGDMGEKIVDLCDWVYAGGHLMTAGTLNGGGYSNVLFNKFGILNSNDLEYVEVFGMKVVSDKIINADGREFRYDEPALTALNVSLLSDCEVLITDIEKNTPLLWKNKYGEGEFVVNNQVLVSKINRGLLCTSYGLLDDICIYPVINASAYYLDDFPSPVPEGDGTFIKRDYNMNIGSFYSNVWWPNVLKLEDEYGIIHTGLVIENYDDNVWAPFYDNDVVTRFTFYGNMLLNNGGEIGIHGYNHMPLCMDNYDYLGLYDSYVKWPSIDEMVNAISTVNHFCNSLFENEKMVVYVPPSNILSSEGREALKIGMPDLRVIASTFFEDEAAYCQEFEVASDGIVETPRITSGEVMDDYSYLSAFSELNFHYVQSHFMHPDDTLDVDRGAEYGWKELYKNLKGYIEYIKDAAPIIRNVSGSGMGEAVREFDKLTVNMERTENGVHIKLGGFYKEAYLMFRLNDQELGYVGGGAVDKVAEDLYLLHAVKDDIRIDFK